MHDQAAESWASSVCRDESLSFLMTLVQDQKLAFRAIVGFDDYVYEGPNGISEVKEGFQVGAKPYTFGGC